MKIAWGDGIFARPPRLSYGQRSQYGYGASNEGVAWRDKEIKKMETIFPGKRAETGQTDIFFLLCI